MADVRPKDLPAAGAVNPTTGAIIIDDGVNVARTNATDMVNAAIPLASQAEAEAATDNAKRTTPLRVAQYVTAQLGGTPLSTAFGVKANASALGVTGSADNLGTFTGTTIPDDQTAKQALQALETAIEDAAGAGSSLIYEPTDRTEGQTLFLAPDGVNITSTPLVIINGSILTVENYSWDVNGVTLNSGTSLSDDIMIVIGLGVDQNTVSATNVIGLSSGNGSTFMGWLRAGTGAVFRTVFDRLTDTINAKDFGAVGDGSTPGQQGPINNALALGKDVRINPGVFVLSDAIITSAAGQVIKGAGKHLTVLEVPASFNLSAAGVIHSVGGEPGVEVRDLTIRFVQPDTTVRANLVNYPPAIYAPATPRLRVNHVKITRAKTGIDMRGNSGGAIINDLEISSFDYFIRIDGSLDSVRLNAAHHWPFDLTANQQAIFFDINNVGVESGRCDDFHMQDSLFIGGGKQARFINTGLGSTFGNVVNTDFDTFGSVEMTDGFLSFGECFWTVGNSAYQPIVQTGGNLRISNSQFQTSNVLTNPMVSLGGTSYTKIIGCDFYVIGDMTAIETSGNSTSIVSGNQFILPQNTSPAKPVVKIGGRMTFTDNRANDKGSGTGNLVQVTSDNIHHIKNNAFLGWGLDMPATWTSADVFGNTALSNGDFINSRLVGKLQFARYIATANGAGAINITHNITDAHQKVLSVQAGYKGGAGEWQDCTVDYVDGTVIAVTGALPSSRVRVNLTYTETQDAW